MAFQLGSFLMVLWATQLLFLLLHLHSTWSTLRLNSLGSALWLTDWSHRWRYAKGIIIICSQALEDSYGCCCFSVAATLDQGKLSQLQGSTQFSCE